MESFTIFYFFSHTTFRDNTCKMTGYDMKLHLRYRNSIWNKETEIKIILFMHKNVVTIRLPMNFTGSYTKDEPNFPLWDNLISQKTVWSRQGIEFQGLLKTQ